MVKSIKKRYKIFLFSGSAFLLIILFAFFSVRSNAIQTWVVANVVDRINNNTEANITFESLQITFFSKLIVTDLLLLDNNSDTLLYTKELIINLKKIRRDKKIISLSRVTLHDPLFKIVSDTSKNTNLRQYLSLLPEKKNPADSVKVTFSIDQIDLVNARFAMTTEEYISEDENLKVDFKDLSVNNLNATIEDFMVKDGTLSMAVYRASFVEKSGLTIDRFASIITIRKGLISFRNIELSTPNSAILSDEISLEYDQPDAFRNFAEDVKIKLLFNRSTVSPTDISLFIPNLNIDPGIVSFSGTITGSFAQLRGRSILIEAGEITKIDCDFDLAGLPDFENTYIFVDVNSLKTRISEVANLGLISDDKIPQKMDREVGIMTFRGTFSGFSTDFVTYGKLITQAGSLSTDISFRPSGKDLFKYSGALSGTGINLGMIVSDTSHYGIANFNINVDGSLRSMNEFSAILKGEISEVSLNNYVYSNISLNGEFSEKRWNGTIKTMDENLDMEFVGMIDLQNKLPVFDFTLNVPNAKLFDLNIDKADSNSFVSLLIEANFTGNKVDNLDGEIRFLNSTIVRHGKKIEIINGLLKTFIENDKPAIDIKTDFINASIRGYYNFGSMPNSFETVLSGLFPSRFVRPVLSNPELPNKFELKVVLNNTQEVTDFFNTKLTVADGTTINMNYLVDNTVSLIANSDFIKFNTTEIKDIKLGAVISDSTSSVDIESSSFMLAGKSELEDFTVNLSSRQDTLDVNIQWDNNEILLNQGSVEMMAIFTNPDGNNHIGVLVRPTDVFIKNRLWKINNSSIEISNRAISVNDLLVNTSEDFFKLSGVISERSEDTIMVEFKGLDLGFLNEMGKKKPEGELRLDIEGTLSGKVLMTSALKDMMIETENFVIEDFKMIKQSYGNIFIKSQWDNQMKVASISLFNDHEGLKAIDIIGSFNPEEKELQLTAKANRLPIEALNPILSSFAYGINGYATGEVRLKGKLKEPVLSGALYVDNGTIGIDYLKTIYFFNDSVRFNESGILFKSIEGRDEKGNKITINGLVKHKYFKNFGFDVTVSPVKAMALNTRTKDNDLFYGTAYATGLVTIKGSDGNVAIDVSATTDRNTDFFVPMNSTQTIGEYSFITFATDSSTTSDIVVAPVEQGGEDDGTFELNMELQVTPDAEVQLVLDSKAGDVMKGRGSGILNINLDRNGDFSISGDYIISSGEYLFTLGNIVNKRFNVTSGSKISWNGDVEKAEIDIKAVYKLEASLYDLLQMEEYRDRVPVECHLHLTGLLLNPIINFDIVLPTSDQTTRSYFQNLTSTDEAMSRQFLYLLVINQFYPDPAFLTGGSINSATSTGTSAIENTTTEMLSNQLSNWLSQISNDFDIGFVYRPGNEISSQQLELALSTQLLNDRVTINGNVDVGANQNASTATNFTGVFDVEYKINEKVRLKFFNRSNDNILYETAPYTQGLGILFRQDFDRIKNIFRRDRKNEGKKEEEPGIEGISQN